MSNVITETKSTAESIAAIDTFAKESIVLSGLGNASDVMDIITSSENNVQLNEYLTDSKSNQTAGLESVFGIEETSDATEEQIKAFNIAMLTSKNSDVYHKEFNTTGIITNEAANSAISISDWNSVTSTNEAYSNNDIKINPAITSVVAFKTSKQSDFDAVFFPAKTLPPGQNTVHEEVQYTLLHKDKLHTDPKDYDRGEVTLIEASLDPDAFDFGSNTLYPIYDASTDVFANDVPSRRINGREVKPVKHGGQVDWIALSTDTSVNGRGVRDTTDQLGTAIRLSEVAIEVTDGTDKAYVLIDTTMLKGASFTPHQSNSHNRELTLSMVNITVPFNRDYKIDPNTTPYYTTLLSGPNYANMVIELEINASGTVDLDRGIVKIPSITVTISRLWRSSQTAYGTKMTEIKDTTIINNIKSKLQIKVLGYLVDPHLTNTNVRERGTLIQRKALSEAFYIPYGVPVSILKSTVEESKEQTLVASVDDLITTINQLNAHDAVKTLLEYGELLKTYTNVTYGASPTVGLRGVSTRLLRLYYKEDTIDVEQVVLGLESRNQITNITAAFSQKIRIEISKAMTDSIFSHVMEVLKVPGKPIVNIGFGHTLGSIIKVEELKNSLADLYDVRIALTNDKRMRNKIVINFSVSSNDDKFALLRAGVFYYIPSPVYTVVKTENNALNTVATAPRRSAHRCISPVQIQLTVTNLEKGISKFPFKP